MDGNGQQETQGDQEELSVQGRRRLGRGLNALLGTGRREPEKVIEPESQQEPSPDSSHIDVELIERNPSQPRKMFNELAMNDLAQSIKMHGLLQPVLVRPYEGKYQLIAGERRWLAAKKAGLTAIPCRVLELSDQYMAEAALEENLKREDLNALEKGEAFKTMLDRFSLKMDDLAKRMSMDRSTVSNLIRLLDLTDKVKEELRNDRITNGHARALLGLEEQAAQIGLCQQIIDEKLSVRKTEQLVKQLQRKEPEEKAKVIPFPGQADQTEPEKKKQAAPELSNHLLSLQEQLGQVLGAQIKIKLTTDDSGQIQIPFATREDFERILTLLRRAA